MNFKRITLGTAAMLLAGSVGVAYATTNLVQNGDFSTATPPYNGPTQFGPGGGTVSLGNGTCTWGGQFVSGWNGTSGYNIWYSSAAAASGTSACTQFGQGSSNDGTSQRLPAAVTAPPVGAGSFVGLDGQIGYQGGLSTSQTINNLAVGTPYTLQFYWASTQEMSRTGATWDYIEVTFGSQTMYTDGFTSITTDDIGSSGIPGAPSGVSGNVTGTHGFSGWHLQSLTFTPTSASQTLGFLDFGGQVLCSGKVFDSLDDCDSSQLSLLSLARSSGLPPFALLTGITLSRDVPEPPVLALFGGGLLGLGLLTVFARRRALREKPELA